jgi:outer membrane autotransporter protein
MTGPYIVARLKDDLVVDARIAWGQSDNDISPFDTYEDEFETERLLVSGKLTGGVQLSKARLRPQIGLIYFEETQLGYDDSNGIYIPSQTVSLGRLTFSPNLSQSWDLEDGSTLGLNLNLKGIWDFETADLVDIDTGLLARANAELRARTEAGFNFNLVNGMRLQANGFFDGIGVRDYRSYGGTVTVTIPLNW